MDVCVVEIGLVIEHELYVAGVFMENVMNGLLETQN